MLKYRRLALGLSFTSYIGLLCYYHFILLSRTEPLSGVYLGIEMSLLLANRWLRVLAILGYGYAYLNRPSCGLKYFAQAVYPSYLFHQSILIVAAFSLNSLMLGFFTEAFCVIVITVGFCLVSYEILKRIDIMKPLVGISSQSSDAEYPLFNKILGLIGWMLILPFGYLIIF